MQLPYQNPTSKTRNHRRFASGFEGSILTQYRHMPYHTKNRANVPKITRIPHKNLIPIGMLNGFTQPNN
jgi:hypothetical protein